MIDRLFYVNIGESEYRSWEDCRRYEFLAAGGNEIRIRQIASLVPDDLVTAYLKGYGYVGIGLVLERAVPVEQFKLGDKLLFELPLKQPGILTRAGKHTICDHLVKLKWLITVDKSQAKWQSGLFASQLVKASLKNQPATIAFLENEFRIRFERI